MLSIKIRWIGAAGIALALFLLYHFTLQAQSPEIKEGSHLWELVWIDDFEGDEINDSVWSIIPRGRNEWNNTMSPNPECYKVDSGFLHLYGIQNKSFVNDTSKFLTGGIYTKDKFKFEPTCRIEVRVKIKSAIGAWPAIWMMPFEVEKGWPWDGEIDIVEKLNFDNFAYQSLHTHYTRDLKMSTPQRSVKPEIKVDDFNVYGVEIFPDSLRFTLNGKITLTYPKVESLVDEGQFPFYRNWYLIIGMQLGGTWVGDVDPSTLPCEIEIDWVKYFRELDK